VLVKHSWTFHGLMIALAYSLTYITFGMLAERKRYVGSGIYWNSSASAGLT
jgi:hypothetical protein